MRTDGRSPIEQRLAAAGLPPLPRTAWLEIDLDALVHNLGVLRGLASPNSPVRPVVKADAYGHGAVPVARALQDAGIDGLCVATLDEAFELREAGLDAPILVLYPIPPDLAPEAARQRIAVSAGDPGLLEGLLAAMGAVEGSVLDVELEVETGLGRGGFREGALLAAVERLRAARGVRLAGLWTHYQAAEDPKLADLQTERFEGAATDLGRAGVSVASHVAASVGLLTGGAARVDRGVRPGLALYGLMPDELEAIPAAETAAVDLRPVMALYARPVRVMDLPAGWGVSYGPTFRTKRPSRIATLPFGYGDGWSRRLSNRAVALVRGTRVPLVGNVAMDAVMADVTDVPGVPVGVADEFVLIGRDGGSEITVGELAHERNTNRWEVVTNMARRVPRVYHAAAGLVGLRTLTTRSELVGTDRDLER